MKIDEITRFERSLMKKVTAQQYILIAALAVNILCDQAYRVLVSQRVSFVQNVLTYVFFTIAGFTIGFYLGRSTGI